MADAARKTPQLVCEDPYVVALEAFIRTSAGYLDVGERVPGREMSRDHCERAVLVNGLRRIDRANRFQETGS